MCRKKQFIKIHKGQTDPKPQAKYRVKNSLRIRQEASNTYKAQVESKITKCKTRSTTRDAILSVILHNVSV